MMLFKHKCALTAVEEAPRAHDRLHERSEAVPGVHEHLGERVVVLEDVRRAARLGAAAQQVVDAGLAELRGHDALGDDEAVAEQHLLLEPRELGLVNRALVGDHGVLPPRAVGWVARRRVSGRVHAGGMRGERPERKGSRQPYARLRRGARDAFYRTYLHRCAQIGKGTGGARVGRDAAAHVYYAQ